MIQAAATETAAIVRPALPEFAATIEPMHDYGSNRDVFVIRKADGILYEVTYGTRTGYPMYETVADAQDFIDDGGLIEVEVLNCTATLAAAGWDDEAGYCEANFARFRAYCEAERIHFYAAEKQDFSLWAAKREAQKRGLRKVFAEDLS